MTFMRSTLLVLLAAFHVHAWSADSEPTSVDLYCETMTIAFFEVALNYKPPANPKHQERVSAAEREMLDTCKSMPVVGGNTKKQKEMTPQQMSILACVAMAEGMATAKASEKNDTALYSKLSRSRSFFEGACKSNKKSFLRDMKERGPEYTLKSTY